MIGQSNQKTRTESRANKADINISWNNMEGQIQVNSPQVDMHTPEENIVSKVRSDVDNVVTTVKTRVQDAVLTAIENLVIPGVELAMKSANASSGRSVDGNVLKPDQKGFLGNVEGLQRTASSKILSHRDFNKIDETRGNFTVEEGDLVVNERNFELQTDTHDMVTGENAPQETSDFLYVHH